ncbi:family 43 glycosylhydrolase [Iningainema tapete]|uniref:Family 43 glycosylhydrolase n=1 Tax=Iningainema tapete BLCC-T55 TaxID=2748662 RepID=A0A8J6XUC9_9CYAN|nr:family 43 glycosylhydrolase [Iningainema tapete]MBD2776137.1 family 43 glycosylhydrolase [Iningainema tapete BLCC-T55]
MQQNLKNFHTKVSPLYQKIISTIEPLPLKNPVLDTASLVERSQIKIAETVTKILRFFRQGEPMNWDPWILKDGDIYRLFYLRGVEGANPWWATSKICGAISNDLHNWQDLGTILEPDPNNDWESGRILAGCAYKEKDIYYLFYSAGGKEFPHNKNEAIGLAISQDGLHYSRYSQNYLLKAEDDDPWYGRSSWTQHYHWRDPYIFKDENTGKYYMFICASSKVSGNFQGCVGLASASEISGPYKLLPPVIEAPTDTAEHWPYYHLERPQVIYKEGKYHLFFSCFKMLMNPKWLQQVKHKRVTSSSLYWYISDHITGPYQPIDKDECIVKGSEKTGMYGTNFLQVSTNPDKYIAYGWYHRLHTLEISPTFSVVWKNTDYTHSSGDQQKSYLDSLIIARNVINYTKNLL